MRGLLFRRKGVEPRTHAPLRPPGDSSTVTALDRYAKLEAIGQYHDLRSDRHADGPREVVVSFGERSLIIMSLDDHPITHWPLASLRTRDNPSKLPIMIAPEGINDERLLLDDPEMSAAIAEVCPDLYRTPPRPPRRRRGRLIAGLLLAVGLPVIAILLWPMLPQSLADFMTPKREAALGQALLMQLPHVIEPASPPALCIGEDGIAALGLLTQRLDPASLDTSLILSVLDHPAADALLLPGGHVLIFRGLLRAARTPEELAGILAHAIGHAVDRDPIRVALDEASLVTTARMLFGNIAGNALTRETAHLLLGSQFSAGAEAQADATGFEILAAAGLSSMTKAGFAERLSRREPPSPYSARHPWTLRRARAAAVADTIGDAPFTPALRDRDWIALGNICDRTAPTKPAGF